MPQGWVEEEAYATVLWAEADKCLQYTVQDILFQLQDFNTLQDPKSHIRHIPLWICCLHRESDFFSYASNSTIVPESSN